VVDGIRVYFEGDKKLKPGFHAFFGNHVRSGLKFDLIHGNGGSETIKDFMNAVETHPDAFNILLIDSDKPDNGKLIPSLKSRSEWNSQIASDVSDDQIHFMVQVMEAWFLADRNALKAFYGGAFAENQLPSDPMVERVSKNDVTTGLRNATRGTQKMAYHKTNHAPALLGRIDAAKVRLAAPSCDRLLKALAAV
jgi:hypothetical protein